MPLYRYTDIWCTDQICYKVLKLKIYTLLFGKNDYVKKRINKYLYESKTLNMWFVPKSQSSGSNIHTKLLEGRKYLVKLRIINKFTTAYPYPIARCSASIYPHRLFPNSRN